MNGVFAALLLAQQSAAFTLPTISKVPTILTSTTQLEAISATASDGVVVVVSPPGGVGEVAAVKAASSGSSVRWLVVSNADGESSTNTNIQLSPSTLKQITACGGTLDLASSTVEELQNGDESSLQALSTWCSGGGATSGGAVSGLICTYDGCGTDYTAETYQAGIRLATQQASRNLNGPAVAILAADQDLDNLDGSGSGNSDSDESEEGGGIFGLFKNTPTIASTLVQAVPSSSSTTILRHGELFGIPESNPNFSPLVGGPKRTPIMAEEYTMRDVRIDPFVFSGNIMASVSSSKSNRHSVGTAAALFATKQLSPIKAVSTSTIPSISLTSQTGLDEWTIDNYQNEIQRVQEQLESNKGSMTLFTNEEMIVSNVDRLTNWLATKWAPAVLKTYDLATIRSGARPVYALSPSEGTVEIVWQKLDNNMESVNVGKMILSVSEKGVSATRAAGDAIRGYGTVSMKPLPGEDVLVRRLSEATSQAIDKGLAKKVRVF